MYKIVYNKLIPTQSYFSKSLVVLFLFLNSFSLIAQKDSTDFVSTWNNFFLSPGYVFSISTDTAYTYNYDVDWNNDGVFDTLGVKGDIRHKYAISRSNDTVTIRIRGRFPRILFGAQTNNGYHLLSIDQWGDTHLKNLSHAFYQCSAMSYKANDIPNLDSVTNLSYMFSNAYYFNGTIGNWNVSAVTNMKGMFKGANNFNQPIGNWDVGAVNDMNEMFRDAKSFNQAIGKWDVSVVTDMAEMFRRAISFNQAIGKWDVSKVNNMQDMFYRDTSFNQPIGKWNVSSVKNMSRMFSEATSFNQPIGNWAVDSVENMYAMFSSATSFNQALGNWNIRGVTSIPSITSMFTNATSFNQNLSNWDISNLSNLQYIFDQTAISVSNYDSILIAWQAKNHQPNVNFGAIGLHYCLGDSARQRLIADGWTFNGDTLNCNFVGIEKNEIVKTEFSLFPNPTNGIVTLTLENKPNDLPFCVYNQKGQLIKSIKLTEGENNIDLSGYANGLYFITNGEVGEKLLLER